LGLVKIGREENPVRPSKKHIPISNIEQRTITF